MQANASEVAQERAPIAILGVPFDNVNLGEALALVGDLIQSGKPHYAASVSVDFLVQALDDVELRHILFDAHLVLAEDNLIVRSSKILGNSLPGGIKVSNLISELLALAEQKKWRVFLLGGNDDAAAKIRQRHPALHLDSHAPPDRPLLEMDHADIRRRVHAAQPHILLVAFGSTKQEKWISMNYREARVPFVIGAGTSLDFLAGGGKRPASTGKNFRKFIRAVFKQWWQLRNKKSKAPMVDAGDVMPDPLGNLVIRAPARLGAAEAQTSQAEWLRAVENSHVLFDLTDTVLVDSTGIGVLVRLRRRARELGWQFILIAPRPPVEAALKLMKLDEFFAIQASLAGARILMESSAGAATVTSGVLDTELQIRWNGEVTALNAVELGAFTEGELSQITPGMTVVIDLSRVTFVDSTGIGLMVRFKKNLKRRDINLKFANALPAVRNVVRQTQLEEFLLDKSNAR
jgi:N-acetylglucosaminyldiphosphoundecaprenol N-acetyl-beta-D-mannosaminyltransferase